MVNEGEIKRGIDIKGAKALRKRGLNLCKCGNDAVFIAYKGGWFVKCTCCELMIAKQISVVTETIIPFETQEEATKAWNKSNPNKIDLRTTTSANIYSESQLKEIRDARINMIAEAIRKEGGDVITTRDIASDIGLSFNIVNNNMQLVKRTYPQVQTSHKRGYYWKENI